MLFHYTTPYGAAAATAAAVHVKCFIVVIVVFFNFCIEFHCIVLSLLFLTLNLNQVRLSSQIVS